MNTKISNARHMSAEAETQPLHLRLRSRAISAIAAGCLAASMCPVAAMALPGDANAQIDGAPAIEQQAPDAGGQQGRQMQPGDQANAPDRDGQAPSGQPMGGPVDDQVREYLSENYGIAAPDGAEAPDGASAPDGKPGGPQMGDPSQAPEIPEGQVNVQAIIDSMRDVIGKYGVETLQAADFGDEAWCSELAEFVRTATQQRLEMFAQKQAPANLPDAPESGQAPGDQAPDGNAPSGEAPTPPEGAPSGNAPSSEKLDSALLGSLVELIVSAL